MQELFADQEEALAAQRQSTHAHMQQHHHHHHHSHHHHHDSHMDRPLPADQAPVVLLHPLPTAQLLHLLPTAPQPAVAHTAPVMPVNGWHTISVADPPLTCAHDPQHIMLELAKAPPPPVPPAAAAVSPATLAELQARAHAAAAASSSTSESASAMTLGMRLLIWSSGILAVMICTSGCVLLSQEERALLLTEDKCNQLYVWCMLFVMFEGIYLIFLVLNAFNFDTNFHAKRAKTSILFIVLCVSILLFIWGTIIINTVTCPENEFELMWTFFRVLYWFIIGIWSVVLLALTAPVALFFAFKVWADRNRKKKNKR